MKKSMTALTLSLAFGTAAAADLNIEVYNPGEDSMFAISSELISGPKEMVLIDAQFQTNDAQQLVDKIKASGKTLTTIYISHSDPDFYFGLEPLQKAFPKAKIVATQATVNAIKGNYQLKADYWFPIMKANAPSKVIVPEVLNGNQLTVDGETLHIKGGDIDPKHTYVWVPQQKTILGGVNVYGNNIHVWMADNQSAASQSKWQQTLQQMQALKPKVVIPGHFLPGAKLNTQSIAFTSQYIGKMQNAVQKENNAQAVIDSMKKQYPALKDVSSLELSAKVLKGEMQWP